MDSQCHPLYILLQISMYLLIYNKGKIPGKISFLGIDGWINK